MMAFCSTCNQNLPGPQTDYQKAKDIKEIAQQGGLAIVAGDGVAVPCVEMSPHDGALQRVVYPFANGDKDSSEGDDLDGGVADSLHRDGQRQNEKKGAEYEHSLVPVVNNELRERVYGFHFDLLLGVVHAVFMRRAARCWCLAGNGTPADDGFRGSYWQSYREWVIFSTRAAFEKVLKIPLPSACHFDYTGPVTVNAVIGFDRPESKADAATH